MARVAVQISEREARRLWLTNGLSCLIIMSQEFILKPGDQERGVLDFLSPFLSRGLWDARVK